MGIKIIVCGGRDYADRDYLYAALDKIHKKKKIDLLVNGYCTGADHLADAWARDRGIDRIIFPANWTGRGKSAGPVRNYLMLRSMRKLGIDAIVAFPGDKGTKNMMTLAKKAGVTVVERPKLWTKIKTKKRRKL